MHCSFQHFKCTLSAADSLLESAEGITLFLFSVVMCMFFCKYVLQKNHVAQFRALSVFYLKKLSMGDTDASHALAEPDTILLWPSEEHLQHTICLTLSNGKIKAIQTKFTLFNSELVDDETTRGEQLAQLCHHITLSLFSVPHSPALCLCLPQSALCFQQHVSYKVVLTLPG